MALIQSCSCLCAFSMRVAGRKISCPWYEQMAKKATKAPHIDIRFRSGKVDLKDRGIICIFHQSIKDNSRCHHPVSSRRGLRPSQWVFAFCRACSNDLSWQDWYFSTVWPAIVIFKEEGRLWSVSGAWRGTSSGRQGPRPGPAQRPDRLRTVKHRRGWRWERNREGEWMEK